MTERCNFGRLSFSSIGRQCFGLCLKQAWYEVKREAELKALPREQVVTRIASLKAERDALKYQSLSVRIGHRRHTLSTQIAELDAIAV